MLASFSLIGSGRGLPAFVFAAMALVLSLGLPLELAAQQADGDFEGEKTWTDKDGKSHEIKPPNLKDSKVRASLGQWRTEGKFSGDEELFNNWWQDQVRQLTWKENIAKLPEKRRDLKKLLIQYGKAPVADVHKEMNDAVLEVCTAVAKDTRYPRAVRINCTLMLADLDEREHNAGSGQEAVPMPGATTALVEMLADEKQPLFIRLEATIALTRHVQPAMPAAVQAQAAEALVKIMQSPVPEGKEQAGHVWLRFRASDLLLEMIKHKLPVDQAALAGSLAALLADENLPLWVRSAYAGDLGRLDSKSLPPDKTSGTVRSLNDLMLAILQSSPFLVDETAAEETDEKQNQKPKEEEKPSRETNADADADKKKKEEDTISPAAQKLLSEEIMWQLGRVRRAMYGEDAPVGRKLGPNEKIGLYAAASDDHKAAMKKIVEQIDKCVKALNDVPDKMDELAETLRNAIQESEGLFGTPAAEGEQTALADEQGGAAKPAGNASGGNR